ncbi:hypothetical protein D3C71_2120730 [compost metagenome]
MSSTLLIGMIPPAVEVRKASSALINCSTWTRSTWIGMPTSFANSSVVLRVMPSRQPESGVYNTPSLIRKILEPGASVR